MLGEIPRISDPFWTNIFKDHLEGEPVRARNMYFEATMIDFINSTVHTIPRQVIEQYRVEYDSQRDVFGQDNIPIEVQENLMLLQLYCDEVKDSAGLNPEARGDAFGDVTALIYVDNFRLRASALLRKNPNWSLIDLCDFIKDHENWYEPSKAAIGVGQRL